MKTSKARDLSLQARFRIRSGNDIALGPGKVQLLEFIHRTGSITDAAKQMGMSYMRAWTLIRTSNRCFKTPLVVTTRGGQEGGGAKLTDTGLRALKYYQEMDKAGLRAAARHWRLLRGLLGK
jgi:molybdate transport system regulatory protein